MPFGLDDGIGLLILDGFMCREVALEHRAAVELLGPGDLLRPCGRTTASTRSTPTSRPGWSSSPCNDPRALKELPLELYVLTQRVDGSTVASTTTLR